MTRQDLRPKIKDPISDEVWVLNRKSGKVRGDQLLQDFHISAQEIPAVDPLGGRGNRHTVFPDNTMPFIPRPPDFRGRVPRSPWMSWIVVTRVGMAVEAEGDGIFAGIASTFSLRIEVVNFDLQPSIAPTNTAVSSSIYERLLSDFAGKWHRIQALKT